MAGNFYELTYIVDASLEPEKIQEIIKKYTDMLTQGGASFEESNEWGVKNLAYPIQKHRTGYYVNQYFTAPGEAVRVLEKYIRLDEGVLRFMALKYDNKMKRHRQLKKEGKVRPFNVIVPKEDTINVK